MGVLEKIPSVGEEWVFSGITQYVISKLPFASVSKEVSVENHSYDMLCLLVHFEFIKINLISHERFCLKTHFKTKAQSNSEMVY